MLSFQPVPLFNKLKYKKILLLFLSNFVTAIVVLVVLFFLFKGSVKEENSNPTYPAQGDEVSRVDKKDSVVEDPGENKTQSKPATKIVQLGATFKSPEGWNVTATGGDAYLALSFEKDGNSISVSLNGPARGNEEANTIEKINVAGIDTTKASHVEGNKIKEIDIGEFCKTPTENGCYLILFRYAEDFKNNAEAVAVFNEVVSTFKFVEVTE